MKLFVKTLLLFSDFKNKIMGVQQCVEGSVTGRVQHVHYRAYGQEYASTLGLSGSLHNVWDGRVSFHAQGSENAVANFVHWLWKGSPKSHVTAVEVHRCGSQ